MSTTRDPNPNIPDLVYGPKPKSAQIGRFSRNSAEIEEISMILNQIRFVSNYIDEEWVQKRLNELVEAGFRVISKE